LTRQIGTLQIHFVLYYKYVFILCMTHSCTIHHRLLLLITMITTSSAISRERWYLS